MSRPRPVLAAVRRGHAGHPSVAAEMPLEARRQELKRRLEAALLVELRVLRSAPVLRRVALQEQRLVPVQ